MTAVAWLNTQPDVTTAWDACERADWMLWLASRLDIPRPLLVLAVCDCARTALQYVPEDEGRPLAAIEAAEAWAADPTDAAADAADAASYAASYAAARAAARASAYATRAAADAVAYSVADAAARAAADAAAGAAAQKQMAELVRGRIPAALIRSFAVEGVDQP